MKPIGGYFELELRKGKEYHDSAIRLNSGRNAFKYILRAREYKKVYLPYFTCDVMLEPILKLKLKYEFYHINEQLEPIFDFNQIGANETFLYTNYFGIKSLLATKISRTCPNLIIDNSQAFFEKPLAGIDTFYSPRKFFGVPDGAYLYCDKYSDIFLEQDTSIDRFCHLLGRIELGAEIAYPLFRKNDDALSVQPIKKMSDLTQRLLQSIDYMSIYDIRRANFQYLNDNLNQQNLLKLNLEANEVPLVYPFLCENHDLKHKLIGNKIFVATYWPNVKDWIKEESLEVKYSNYMVHLPIDQRIDTIDLDKVIKIIEHEK